MRPVAFTLLAVAAGCGSAWSASHTAVAGGNGSGVGWNRPPFKVAATCSCLGKTPTWPVLTPAAKCLCAALGGRLRALVPTALPAAGARPSDASKRRVRYRRWTGGNHHAESPHVMSCRADATGRSHAAEPSSTCTGEDLPMHEHQRLEGGEALQGSGRREVWAAAAGRAVWATRAPCSRSRRFRLRATGCWAVGAWATASGPVLAGSAGKPWPWWARPGGGAVALERAFCDKMTCEAGLSGGITFAPSTFRALGSPAR